MIIFFDTEFTGLHKDTTLISIGLVSETGEKFYAEFNDYDEWQVTPWIEETVLPNLMHWDIDYNHTLPEWFNYGSKEEIKVKLLNWLSQWDFIDWVSDVSHYDFVLLIDLLFGNALDISPDKYSPICHDINTGIATYFDIEERDAFNMSREDILASHGCTVEGEKHNSLYDAEVIKCIFEHLYE